LKLSRLLATSANVNYRNNNYVRRALIYAHTFSDSSCLCAAQSSLPLTSSQPRKALYCGECLEQVARRERPALAGLVIGAHLLPLVCMLPFRNFLGPGIVGNDLGCDWPDHRRNLTSRGEPQDICSCSSSKATKCNWLICVDCFTMATLDLRSPHQICKFQVSSWLHFAQQA
jgi:hypothetical protein